MKKYFFAFILFASLNSYAGYDINSGFSYGNTNEEAAKEEGGSSRSPASVESSKDKDPEPQMKVLRFYNSKSRISDPMAEKKLEESKVKFHKIKDKTLTSQPKAPRELASTADMQTVESVLRNLESQMGIRSMPVVGFGENDFNTDHFIKRIEYLEHKLNILNRKVVENLMVHERIQRIQSELAKSN